MQPISVKQRNDDVTITLGDVLDISQAGVLHNTLMKALAVGLPMRVDLRKLERIDTAAIQVLAAFAYTARARGLKLKCKHPGAVADAALRTLGLSDLFETAR